MQSVALSVGNGSLYLSDDGSGRITAVSKPDSKCKFTILYGGGVASGAGGATASAKSSGAGAGAGAGAGVGGREFASLIELESVGVVKVCDQIVLKSWFGSYV